eukprot:TRINITY_DN19190_c0_g1_i1.p2 TRINITY_DN19190_c0_g1~~TRINITY_DN19190_c0_g1_i1.p2  ORF type:complete len:102 (-),score=19.69 TRINITY_DN19190_c0_g1_i1:35-340(-)
MLGYFGLLEKAHYLVQLLIDEVVDLESAIEIALEDGISEELMPFMNVYSTFVIENLSLIHISEPTRPLYISYAVFCLKKKKHETVKHQQDTTSTTKLSYST